MTLENRNCPLRPARRGIALGLIALAICAGAGAGSALALPRYAAQYGQSCILCHANPTGGGLRSLYASQFIVPEEIAARKWTDQETQAPSPEIGPGVIVGADLRTLAYQVEGGAGSSIAMQGDVYLQADLGTRSMIYVEHGMDGGGEVFGLTRFAPLDGYVKAGRIVPDHGWRFADHQMFTRRYLLAQEGSDNPRRLLRSGFEVGVSPGPVIATASLLGGREHGDDYAARVLLLENAGELNFGLGASLLRSSGFVEGHGRSSSVFGYLAWGPATWLGQVDESKLAGSEGRLAASELTVAIRRGYDLRFTYGFHDPDIELTTGARRRYGIGLAQMPTPYMSLLVMGNYWDVQPGAAVAENDHVEGQLVVHWFY